MKINHSIDRKLVNQTLAGSSTAFKAIIDNTKGLVAKIIFEMIKSKEDREDLAQEVYIKVYRKIGSFNFKSKLSTWIGTITYHTCLNFLEKKKIPILKVIDQDGKESWDITERKNISLENNPTEAYVFKKDTLQVLEAEIDKLPPLYKVIITLYHNEELSYKEIGSITGLPEGTLKNYLYRARKQLKKNLLFNYKKEDL